jgi:lysophospholipase L1-like esterase
VENPGDNLTLILFAGIPFVAAGGLLFLFKRFRRGQGATMRHVLLVNALIFLFLVGLLLLGGEVYFRFFYDSTDSFMYTKVSRRWYERYCQFNTVSVRDNIEYRVKIQPGKHRVTFIGDSFTAGHGIRDVEDRFVNRVRKLHPEWEVHMLAMQGFDTGDELHFLETWRAMNYQLDLVVLVYCLNDISDLIPERRAAFDRIQAQIKDTGWFLNHSYFLNTLGHRWQVARDPFMHGYFDLVLGAYEGPLWDEQARRLTQLRSTVESGGGRLAVITFPFMHALGPSYPYAAVHRKLETFWSDQKIPHLDLSPVFAGGKPAELTVNRFDAHPNEHANALAVEAINKFLVTQIGRATPEPAGKGTR